ncbi:MAG: glutamate formimidoyltransferase [Bacteroidetes bacterium MED-G17]|nr:MAG: glutamate formimidoyltransferase [Bacteroidetes bacterium MED-G17]|tara:strand:- start:2041 stop:3732 length:1692 start_codon:yes stop_codon:yes gene_type:complete
MRQLIECVPNFSEGRNLQIINSITNEIEKVEGVTLLDVDPGAATNRTVVTFVGEPKPVIFAAELAIKKAAELIDMSKHQGEHPRMGATDVCPLIPVANIDMQQVAEYAHVLGKRIGETTEIPVFIYGEAQKNTNRNNLSVIRAGEYEGMFEKIQKPAWKPDYGHSQMNPQAGATNIGARDFLIAYNINLNTTSTRIANRIAFDVREAGRVKRIGDPYVGKIERDKNNNPIRMPGTCKAVKAIGWYIKEYGVAQISANLVDYKITPLHTFFDEVNKSATKRGVKVTGSELVGLIPLKAILDAGKHYLKKQGRSLGVSESEIIKIAVKSMGLDELGPFDPAKKIIEYRLKQEEKRPLIQMSLASFSDETASESPAPGGGSISSYVGSLGASLAGMVANLSANKKGWESKIDYYSKWAEEAQKVKDKLNFLVDEDTKAFGKIMEALKMPKASEDERKIRTEALEKATIGAIEIPFEVMKTAFKTLTICAEMTQNGLKASVSDAGVGAACTRTAVEGAYMNVLINAKELSNTKIAESYRKEGLEILQKTTKDADRIIKEVFNKVNDK